MVQENDKFHIPRKYRDMSVEKLNRKKNKLYEKIKKHNTVKQRNYGS